MKPQLTTLIILFFSVTTAFPQSKKLMDESVYSKWNRISGSAISHNGEYILYHLDPDNGDQTAIIYNIRDNSEIKLHRCENGQFDETSRYAFFTLKPAIEKLKDLRRANKKKKADELAKDSLLIFDLHNGEKEVVPDIKSFRIGEKWGGTVIIHLDAIPQKKDSLATKKKVKKESGKNGTRLVVRHLDPADSDTLHFVTDYSLSGDSPGLLAHSTGDDSSIVAGVYHYDFTHRAFSLLLETDKKAEQLSLSDGATLAAFLVDQSDSNSLQKSHDLYFWNAGESGALKIADSNSGFLPDGWKISQHQSIRWSESRDRLIFGIRPAEIVQDTNLLEEEIVQVEVWNYQDGRLYTQQEVQADRERKRSFDVIYQVQENTFIPVESESIAEAEYSPEFKGSFAAGIDERPYLKYISWLGHTYQDLYKLDLQTGDKKLLAQKIQGNVQVSPNNFFFYWYSSPDSAWMAYDVRDDKIRKIAHNGISAFYDELNDRPEFPGSNGYSGWTDHDEFILVYDRYDVWKIDPKSISSAERLTRGREEKTTYRVIPLDPDSETIDLKQKILLHQFDHRDKSEGYSWYEQETIRQILHSAHRYSSNVVKARDSAQLFYTKESFQEFPDLVLTDLEFSGPQKISRANPFQVEYRWGSAEIFEWTDVNGHQREGLLFKPEDFDPSRKYPLLVNFYEKNSHSLHAHRAPYAHRSTINYSYYVNRGYVIFNPDIYYENGYPGESCYNAVVSGVLALLDEGFIDKEKMGVQGHSWGGYQIAHLLTKTDIFACAEAGAPVVNMISAYGGIRWGSGMSRMFQYEKTQSRIGGTLWEEPELYIENSPIFNIDLQKTPVLILHNDEDGAVPWYQGIEYFVALRRLGKPAWMLNYNGEPHWPLKWQNRLDFNIRMQQFFDHYLMGKPMPIWMKDGVPAVEKGITSGYELTDENR